MKINIIGGGPAGMYFAILMKRADAAHDITIYERNGPDDTFGWGVVLSGKTLANLRNADETSHAEITRDFEAWDNVDVVHHDEKISIHGNSFSGIARIRLLKILQRRCEQLGIRINFRTEVSDIELLRSECDLLVGADGVNSTVRQQFAEHLQPNLSTRPNKYIWYGTSQLFHGLTLTFRERAPGVFAAHSYKFDKTTSTFIVECDPETWRKAGFAGMSDEDARAYLGEAFSQDLGGHPLLSNNSKWINFVLVKNANWHYENVVLLGDALHTAHFSIGSGTKLAIEDAIALKESFENASDLTAALRQFEKVRKPVIEDYQAAAYESMLWFENARRYMHLSAIELAYSLMTRSGRVDEEELRKRDREFLKRYQDVGADLRVRPRTGNFRARLPSISRRGRRSIRLAHYDYGKPAPYFVTLCVKDQRYLFGEIVDGELRLNDAGRMIERWWKKIEEKFPDVRLDAYQVMPNHFHGILAIMGTRMDMIPDFGIATDELDFDAADENEGIVPLTPDRRSDTGQPPQTTLADAVRWFKTMSTNEYIRGVRNLGWPQFNGKLWQRDYFEHIVRDEESLDRIRSYIRDNPSRWSLDWENPDRIGTDEFDAWLLDSSDL